EWTTLKTTDEINILRRYAGFSKRFMVTMTVLLILFLNFFGLFQFLPNFLDIIVPLNESRERHFSFLAEYFVDQKRYFYPILTHNLLAIYIGGITVISTGTMLMGFIFHICAMLQIARFTQRALDSFKESYFLLIGIGVVSLAINLLHIKYIFDRVRYDWNILKAQTELEIIRKYASYAKLFMIGFILLGFVTMLSCSFLPLIPSILDIVTPLNISRPRQLLFPGEYFVDQQKFFYVILLQVDVTIGLIIITLIATETLYVTYIQHVCGMFQIARFSEFLWSTLGISYSILLLIGITSLIMNLFCVILFSKKVNEIVLIGFFILGHIIYLFVGNYLGQILIDHSTDIFQNICNIQWYNAPLKTQKQILFIMQKTIKNYHIDVGGLFSPSLEGFTMVIKILFFNLCNSDNYIRI
ncbi:hypothetical protein G5I_10348, partial [Acromyrmex echinatior]